MWRLLEQSQLIQIIPNSYVDDFFFFGFAGGIVSYAWYLFSSRNEQKGRINFIAGLWGTFLSGALGGLLAIVFDRAIELSILIGLLNQILYIALIRSVKGNNLTKVLKEVIIKMLTAGSK